jgi:hypothetical protein
MSRKAEMLLAYMLDAVERFGQSLAQIDNHLLGGVWPQWNGESADAGDGADAALAYWYARLVDQRRTVIRLLDSLPRDVVGNELRRRFADAYDSRIDFSIPAGR